MSNVQQMQELNDKLNQNTIELNTIMNTIAQLPPKQTPEALTITPSKDKQTHRGLYNVVTINGDEELKAENIKEGVSIFGVNGTAKTSNIKITNASYLFNDNARLEILDELIPMLDRVTNTSYMFQMATNLTTLDLTKLDMSNVTNMSNMFYLCRNLTDLDLSNIDVSKANIIGYMFYSCTNLTNLKFFKNLGKGYTRTMNNTADYKLDLSTNTKLTYESLMDVINNLYDLNLTYNVANGGRVYRQQLVLGTTNTAKLTAEEIAIATNKGWTVT